MNSKKIKSILIQRQGFTLIELIAVIAVIGVLAAAAVPAIGNINERAQVTQVTKDITVVSDAVSAYIQETGAVPVVNGASEANSIQLKSPEDAATILSPGISVNKFKRNAVAGKFYVIDMALLTNKQVNIENPVDIVAPKLNSIPTSSVFSDIKDDNTVANIKTVANKSVKNTSVIYVIDKEQRVYAINPRNLNKTDLNNQASLPTATGDIEYNLLKPSEEQYAAAQKAAAANVGDAHEVFNVPFMKVQASDILLSLTVSDKSYKN